MGSRYEFQCAGCGYTAVVSGGPDFGFFLKTQTVYCATCRELIDVPTKDWSKEVLNEQDLDGTLIMRCCRCGNHGLDFWCHDDPCPRCGGVVVDSGRQIVLWD
jgi:hypothetical protein